MENYNKRKLLVRKHYDKYPQHEKQWLGYLKNKLTERGELKIYLSLENAYEKLRNELLGLDSAVLSNYNTEIDELNNDLNDELNNKLKNRDIMITNLNNELKDKDILITNLNNELKDRDINSKELNDELNDKGILIKNLNNELNEKHIDYLNVLSKLDSNSK